MRLLLGNANQISNQSKNFHSGIIIIKNVETVYEREYLQLST